MKILRVLPLIALGFTVYAATRIESPKGKEQRLSLAVERKATGIDLPPLPGEAVFSTKAVSSLAVLPPPRQARIALAWENLTNGLVATNYYAALEGSTNLRNWYQVARLPFTATCIVTLTNRPPYEFYRAVAGIK